MRVHPETLREFARRVEQRYKLQPKDYCSCCGVNFGYFLKDIQAMAYAIADHSDQSPEYHKVIKNERQDHSS